MKNLYQALIQFVKTTQRRPVLFTCFKKIKILNWSIDTEWPDEALHISSVSLCATAAEQRHQRKSHWHHVWLSFSATKHLRRSFLCFLSLPLPSLAPLPLPLPLADGRLRCRPAVTHKQRRYDNCGRAAFTAVFNPQYVVIQLAERTHMHIFLTCCCLIVWVWFTR